MCAEGLTTNVTPTVLYTRIQFKDPLSTQHLVADGGDIGEDAHAHAIGKRWII